MTIRIITIRKETGSRTLDLTRNLESRAIATSFIPVLPESGIHNISPLSRGEECLGGSRPVNAPRRVGKVWLTRRGRRFHGPYENSFPPKMHFCRLKKLIRCRTRGATVGNNQWRLKEGKHHISQAFESRSKRQQRLCRLLGNKTMVILGTTVTTTICASEYSSQLHVGRVKT